MARPVLADTDVLVDFLRGHPQAVALVQTHSARLILSSLVVAELYAGVKGDRELHTLDSFVSLFRVVPLSRDLARAGGLYKSRYARSHGVGLADAMVAATVEAENADLKTLNTKHYPMLGGLQPAYTRAAGDRPGVSGDD